MLRRRLSISESPVGSILMLSRRPVDSKASGEEMLLLPFCWLSVNEPMVVLLMLRDDERFLLLLLLLLLFLLLLCSFKRAKVELLNSELTREDVLLFVLEPFEEEVLEVAELEKLLFLLLLLLPFKTLFKLMEEFELELELKLEELELLFPWNLFNAICCCNLTAALIFK